MNYQQNLFNVSIEQTTQNIEGSIDDALLVFDQYYRLAAHTLGMRFFGNLIPFQSEEQTQLPTLVEHMNRPGAQAAWVAATTRVLQPRDFVEETAIEPIHMLLAKHTLSSARKSKSTESTITVLSQELARIFGGFYDHMRQNIELLVDENRWDAQGEIAFIDGIVWADRRALKYIWKQINTRLVSSELKIEFKTALDVLYGQRLKVHKKNRTKNPMARHLYFDWWIPHQLENATLKTLAIPTIIVDICQLVWTHLVRPIQEMRDEHEKAFERPHRAETISVTAGAHTYSRVHKIAGAVSWSFGTSAPGRIIEVGGDHYAGAPVLAQYITHSKTDVATRHSHQIALRLNRPVKLNKNQQVMLADPIESNQFVLTPYEAKTFLYLMMTAPHRPEVVQTTLGELIEVLIPDPDPTHITRYCEQLSEALRTLSRAQLVLPDDTVVDLFSMRRPVNPALSRSDQIISWGLDPNFLYLIKNEIPNNIQTILRQLNGSFLINMSAIMRFGHQEASIMRHYVTACAMWNDAQAFSDLDHFNQDAVPVYSAVQWGHMTNSFSKSALAFLNDEVPDNKKTRDTWRKRKNNDRKKIISELESLEKMGLLHIEWVEKKRGACQFKLLPNNEHLEAYKKARRNIRKKI